MRYASLTVMGLLAACSSGAGQPSPHRVTFAGCPIAGVTAGCVTVTVPDGRSYDITAAEPRPALDGRPIRLTGTPGGGMSICMQGTRLTDVAWSYIAGSC